MRRTRFWAIYCAGVVLGSCLLAGLGWLMVNDVCALNKAPLTATVEIEKGDSVGQIASKLKKAGLIELKGFFVLYEIFTGAKNDIDPGTYELNTSMDYRSLVHNMYDPDARRRAEEGLVLVTIPEGYSVQQIVDLLLKITSLGINLDSLVDYAESLYHSFKDGGGDSSVLSSVGTFFSNVFSSIADFFKGLFS